ncbi:hypothetical protein [Enterococcus faecalis]|nr:hypothetical protein [Enterococcus faecalis]
MSHETLQFKIMKANQQLLHDSARAVAALAHSQPIPGIYELLQTCPTDLY